MDGLRPNSERLRKLMDQHNLRAGDVAEILQRSRNTVYVWLTVEKTGRDAPRDAVRLLELELRGIQ